MKKMEESGASEDEAIEILGYYFEYMIDNAMVEGQI